MFGGSLDRYERSYEEGEVLFHEGDVGDSIFLIKEGKVRIEAESDDTQRQITDLGAGEVVGEMALRNGQHRRTASVVAVSDIKGWKFPKDQFESIVGEHKKFREKVLSSLIERLNKTTNQLMDELSSDRSTIKLSRIILAVLDSSDLEEDEETFFEIDHSEEYLAYRFGTSLDVMEKFLSLQKEDVSIQDFDPDDREKLFSVGKRIVEEGVKNIETEAQFKGRGDTDLIRAARQASQSLDELLDETEILDRNDLQDIMNDRKNLKEVLERHQERGRDDFLMELLERMLNRIESEINRQLNQKK